MTDLHVYTIIQLADVKIQREVSNKLWWKVFDKTRVNNIWPPAGDRIEWEAEERAKHRRRMP